jgi:hypothetical protein
MLMTAIPIRLALASAAIFAAELLSPSAVVAQGSVIALVPHRAVYDLKLARTRGTRPMQAARGRILYDFSGNACEGYELRFRQMSELDSGEGRALLTDMRAITWEEGRAKSMKFNIQSYFNDQLKDSVVGFAERSQNGLGVHLTKPGSKSFDLATNLVFPTEHTRRIITAAREGKTLLETAYYDGSESGEKVYDTLAVIGRPIGPNEKKPTDAAAKQPSLANLTRWPVTVSYFDRSEKSSDQTPVYAVTFELYENGISRAFLLDYSDFVLSGEMTSLDIQTAKPCP